MRVEGAGPRGSRTKKRWMSGSRPPLGSDYTSRGTNRGNSEHVPKAAQHERGERERVCTQHQLNARFLCTGNKKQNAPNTNKDTNIRNLIYINVHEQDTTPASSRTKGGLVTTTVCCQAADRGALGLVVPSEALHRRQSRSENPLGHTSS